jgi:hypothetical protein
MWQYSAVTADLKASQEELNTSNTQLVIWSKDTKHY